MGKIIHKFEQPIYPFDLWIGIGEVNLDIFLNEELEEIEPIKYGKCNAFVYTVREKKTNKFGILMLFENKKSCSTGIIAHESSHAAKRVFEFIEADCSVHEPFEYLLEWIANCCEEVKNFKNGTDKNKKL